MTMNFEAHFLERALELAAFSARTWGFPCGAVVVVAGKVVGEGMSSPKAANDPTGHAEVNAIRDGARRGGSRRLLGGSLFSAMEPCLMCLHAAYWAGLERIFYAAPKEKFKPDYYEGAGSLNEAAAALGRDIRVGLLPGFDGRLLEIVQSWEKGMFTADYQKV